MNPIIQDIYELDKKTLQDLLFDYSGYVMGCLEEGKEPYCVMEYYEHDFTIA
jgi:hypothetical protein